MKKNAFLTFIFSLVPGAGQMYIGYMKRGVSIMTLFALAIMFGTNYVYDFIVVAPIIWAYSFFDTWNLRNNLSEQTKHIQDNFIFSKLVSGADGFDNLAKKYYKIVGYACIGLAALMFFNNALVPLLIDFIPFINYYRITQAINTAVISGLLVWLGLFLLKKNNAAQTQHVEDEYISYKANVSTDDSLLTNTNETDEQQ